MMSMRKPVRRTSPVFIAIACLAIGAAGGFLAGVQSKSPAASASTPTTPPAAAPVPAAASVPPAPVDTPRAPAVPADEFATLFNAATTERTADAARQDALLTFSQKRGLTEGQRGDLRRHLDALYAAAWKRVELPGVTLTAAFLRHGTAERTGQPYQEIAITFKNTGTAAVSEVWGKYVAAGTDGLPIEGREKMCFYATEKGQPGIAPGASYTVPPGSGRWLSAKEHAAKCTVTIDRVVH
jgi:hypothetical protein